MVNATHIRLAAVATRLIKAHGRDIIIRSQVNSGTDWDPNNTDVDVTVKGVQSSFDKKEIDGDLIRSTDGLFLVASKLPITTESRLVDNATPYSIVNVTVIKPGSVLIIQKVQVRL